MRWRWVRKYRGYYKVSDTGLVKSVTRLVWSSKYGYYKKVTGRVLKLTGENRGGYLTVNLSRNGRAVSKLVHRLVLEAFVGPCPPGMECRHYPDRNPANNKLTNLSWGTPQNNADDRKEHGTTLTGMNNPNSKLTQDTVNLIKRLNAIGKCTYKGLARRFGISPCTVGRIVRGEHW